MSVMRAFVAGGLVGLAAVACSALKLGDVPAADGGEDGSVLPPDDDAGRDAGGLLEDRDAGQPPPDFACKDFWTETKKSNPECAARRVTVVDDEGALDATGISIARTPSGRVGIVYNAETDGTAGEMRLVHFIPTSPTFSPDVIKRATNFVHMGNTARLAASAPDVLHVLAHDVDDISQSGDVVVVRLTNGATPLSNPELVAQGAARRAETALAVDGAGLSYATVLTKTSATAAKLAAYSRPVDGAFSALPDVASGLTPAGAPATAATSLFVDPTGKLHLLFHHCEALYCSTPRYHTLDGPAWSYRRTLDNNVPEGLAGYGGRVVAHGTRKYAAYFFRKSGQTPPATADLRLATWVLGDDKTVEVLDQSIPSTDALFPRYRVAMAVDKFGLLHLAIVRPFPDDTKGSLEYRRQVRSPAGATTWLTDIVDLEVLSDTSAAFVDIVVDDAARPHIAYISGVDLNVRYATRYDR